MDSSPEIAVLQSTLEYVTKLHSGGLTSYAKGQREILPVIKDCVQEIIVGLDADRPVEHQQYWKFKLATIFTVKASSDEFQTEAEDFFAGVITTLPAFNQTFCLDVIKHCSLTLQYLQVVTYMKRDMKESLLTELLLYLQSDTDDADLVFFADFLQVFILSDDSLLLEEAPTASASQPASSQYKKWGRYLATPVHEHLEIKLHLLDAFKSLTDTRDIIAETLSCISKLSPSDGDIKNNVRCHMLSVLSLLSLTESLEQNTCLVETCQSSLEACRNIERYLKFASNYSDITHSDTLEMFMTVRAMEGGSCHTQPCIDIASQHKAQLQSLKETFCDNIDQLQDCLKSYISSRQEAYRACFRSPAHCLNQSRASCCHLSYQVSPPFIEKLLRNQMTDTSDDTLMSLTTTMSNLQMKPSTHQAEIDVYIIKNKVGNYQEHLHRLLETSQLDARSHLLSFLCDNPSSLLDASHIEKYVSILLRHAMSPDCFHKVTELLFRLVRNMPLTQQDSLIGRIHQPIINQQLRSANFKSSLTSTFNQLSNTTSSVLKNSASEIGVLALQSPIETLEKLISVALANNKQMDLLLKILQQLPTLCQLQQEGSCTSLLCDLLKVTLLEGSLSLKQQQLFVRLIGMILKPPDVIAVPQNRNRKSTETQPGNTAPLLKSSEFIQECLLPQLTSNALASEQTPVPLHLILDLLNTSLDTVTKETNWMQDLNPIPMVKCLCEIMEYSCTPLDVFSDDESDDGNNEAIKTLDGTSLQLRGKVIQVIKKLVGLLVENKNLIQESAVYWLYNHLHEMTWTLQFYVQPLFDITSTTNFPQRYPECLLKVFVPPAGREFQAFQDDSADGMFHLLELFCVCDDIEDAERVSVKSGSLCQNDSYNAIVAGIVHLLSRSTLLECQRMFAALCHLIRAEEIAVSFRPNGGTLQYGLPLLNYEVISTELQLTQLLHDVFIVLHRTLGSDEEDDLDTWLHLTHVNVTVLKETCLMQSALEQLPISAALFLLSHCFVQLGHQVTLVPQKCVEKIFILTLDIVTIYATLKTKLTKSTRLTHQVEAESKVMLKVIELFEGQDKETLTKKLTGSV